MFAPSEADFEPAGRIEMNPKHFSEGSPGRLVPIETPRGQDFAFVPKPLPCDWDWDAKLWKLLADAKEALGTLNGIGQTLDDPQLLLRPLQSREAIASSNIEGTFVTPEQLLLFELEPSEPTHTSDKRADWFEVANYSRALNEGARLLTSLPISNRVIKAMHSILMRGVRGRSKSPGEFRKYQVQIGSQGRFIPPPAGEVDGLMTNLEKYINTDDERYDPLIRSFLVHYQFETIHPFADGNGRVGRALLALMIQLWLGHSSPWLYMSSFFELHKDEYIECLYNVSSKGTWREWIELCLHGTIAQAKDSIERCHQFNRLKKEFHDRVKKPTPRTHRIIDRLFRNPVLFVSTLEEEFKVTYPTARADLKRLVDAGILEMVEDFYPKAFRCREILDVAYSSPKAAQPESVTSAATEPAPPSSQVSSAERPSAPPPAPSHL